jgi:hypothetical protein
MAPNFFHRYGNGQHRWAGWSFPAGWGSERELDTALVEPKLVVEFGVDIARWGWTVAARRQLPLRPPVLTPPLDVTIGRAGIGHAAPGQGIR